MLTRAGLGIWRPHTVRSAVATVADISADLDTLDVPHHVASALRPPIDSGVPRSGREVRVADEDLPRLWRWVPALFDRRVELPENAAGFAFTYFEHRADQMAIVHLQSLAADWASWNREQTAAMGLLCAECGFDLRTRDAGARIPVNVAPAGNTLRLICSECFTPLSGPDPAT